MTAFPVVLLLTILFLLPFGRLSELPLMVAAVLGIHLLWRDRFVLRQQPAFWPIWITFLAYWLPELLSALDSVEPTRSWTEVALDLRYLPFLWFAQDALRSDQARRACLWGAAAITLFWLLDALVQATFGLGLGGPYLGDRLSGIFGDDNLKLGPVLAAVAPLLLLPVLTRFGRLACAGLWLLLAVAVMLAGARAGWVSFALVSVLMLRHWVGDRRRFLLALMSSALLGIVTGAVLYQGSERFAVRVDRTLAAFKGTEADLDNALAFRLPIWRAAIGMIGDHPVNGVGVRGFRYAYAPYARADDRWLADGDGIGAFHAHQIVLEVAAETGVIGLLCWGFATLILIQLYRTQQGEARAAARPYAYALISMLFPLNTHFAVYSSFWATLTLLMLACWLATVRAAPEVRR